MLDKCKAKELKYEANMKAISEIGFLPGDECRLWSLPPGLFAKPYCAEWDMT
jgi:hypothetical protein